MKSLIGAAADILAAVLTIGADSSLATGAVAALAIGGIAVADLSAVPAVAAELLQP